MENMGYNDNLTICKHCGNMIAKEAKICPHCGGRNKPSALSKILKAIVVVIIICIVADLALTFLANDSIYGKYDTESQLSEEEYKAECISISYEELARNPGEYEGELLTFTGEVFQKCYDSYGEAEYLISVTPEYFYDEVYYSDNIFAYYYYGENDKLLEDDIVTIYGKADGEYTYESVSGAEITVPAFEIEYVEFK